MTKTGTTRVRAVVLSRGERRGQDDAPLCAPIADLCARELMPQQRDASITVDRAVASCAARAVRVVVAPVPEGGRGFPIIVDQRRVCWRRDLCYK